MRSRLRTVVILVFIILVVPLLTIGQTLDSPKLIENPDLLKQFHELVEQNRAIILLRHTDSGDPIKHDCEKTPELLTCGCEKPKESLTTLGFVHANMLNTDIGLIIEDQPFVVASRYCRTLQTAEVIFGAQKVRKEEQEESGGVRDKEKFYKLKSNQCNRDSMTHNLRAASQLQKNVFLVTHSNCIETLVPGSAGGKDNLGVAVVFDKATVSSGSPNYEPLGYIHHQDWDKVTRKIISKEVKVETEKEADQKLETVKDLKDRTEKGATQKPKPVCVELPLKKHQISLCGENPVELEAGDHFVEPGFTAVDNAGKDISSNIETWSNRDNLKKPGEYFMHYELKDSNGDYIDHVTRRIAVQDNKEPEITLNGDKEIIWEKGRPYRDPGATAKDNVDGDITQYIWSTPHVVKIDTPGQYEVKYFIKDSSGHTAEEKRIVEVKALPIIELIGDKQMAIPVGAEYIEPGVKVRNAAGVDDPDLAEKIEVKPTMIDTSKAGKYEIIYRITEKGLPARPRKRIVTVMGAPPSHTPNKIKLNITSLGLGIGATWGEGVLNFQKEEFPFFFQGISLANVGLSASELRGSVQNLTKPEDLEGSYYAIQFGITVGAGFFGTSMVNDKNVQLNLGGLPRGLAVQAGINGITIKLRNGVGTPE